MLTRGARDLLHGLDAGAHCLPAPVVEEPAGPSSRVVVPELLKCFLEKISADAFQVIAEEIAEAEVLLVGEVLAAFEQQPAGLFQDRAAAFAFHAAGFLRADFVECLVHFGDDVETVEDVQGVGAFFAASDRAPTCASRRTRFWK